MSSFKDKLSFFKELETQTTTLKVGSAPKLSSKLDSWTTLPLPKKVVAEDYKQQDLKKISKDNKAQNFTNLQYIKEEIVGAISQNFPDQWPLDNVPIDDRGRSSSASSSSSDDSSRYYRTSLSRDIPKAPLSKKAETVEETLDLAALKKQPALRESTSSIGSSELSDDESGYGSNDTGPVPPHPRDSEDSESVTSSVSSGIIIKNFKALRRNSNLSVASSIVRAVDSRPEILEDEIEIEDKPIGRGKYGKVYRGMVRGKTVAIKKIIQRDDIEQEFDSFVQEIKHLSKIAHPNIVMYMGACTDTSDDSLMIITELLPYDMETFLFKQSVPPLLSRVTRLKMIQDVALGLNWMHSLEPTMVHLDLKLGNLLVDENLNVKICDLGQSKLFKKATEKLSGVVGTPIYMPPEMFKDDLYDDKADVYSFSIAAWEIYHQKQAYSFANSREELKSYVVSGQRPPLENKDSRRFYQLLSKCWAPEPSDRPSFKWIVSELEAIILEETIPDSEARDFWNTFLKGAKEVPWFLFREKFSKYLLEGQEEDLSFIVGCECLRELLVERARFCIPHSKPEETVTMEKFGKILSWFGPLDNEFLNRIEQLCKQDSFHGDIDQGETWVRLDTDKKPGSFIIRFSQSIPGAFTLSRISTEGIIVHHTISHNSDGFFTFGNRMYPTLVRFLNQANSHHELFLNRPCTGSKFGSQFIKRIEENIKKSHTGLIDGGFMQ